jgi:predicted Zn-dependent protease
VKCPACGFNLNANRRLHRWGRHRAELTMCAFCGTLAAIGPKEGLVRSLAPCAYCGAPLEDQHEPGPSLCVSCRNVGGASDDLFETVEETSERVQREAQQLFTVVPGSAAHACFEQVLEKTAASAGEIAPAPRLRLVTDEAFGTLVLPGGTILAGAGFVCELEDEAMLAFALAREIAHEQSGRPYRRFRQRRPSGALSAGFEWGLALITGSGGAIGARGAETLREVASIGYGPLHEESADAAAVDTLGRAGYDTAGAIRVLTLLETRDLGTRPPLAPFIDACPSRSRRRVLAERLAARWTDRARPGILNREAFKRAAVALRGDFPAGPPARRSQVVPARRSR